MNDCTTNGWYWYCDVHDTHGNADSQDEAEYMAAMHETYQADNEYDHDGCDMIFYPVGSAQ